MPPLPFVLVGAIAVVALMAIELAYARANSVRLYGFGDTVTNLSGIAFEHVFMVLVSAPVYAIYMAAYRQRFVDGIPLWVGAPLALLYVDLAFYFWHRLSHRVALFWFGHAVHHSSEEFNVSVAIRASGWAVFTQRFFFLPLAFIGIPVGLLVLADGFTNLYTLFVHTKIVGKLGVIERVFITPSHHRVHHGRNPEYLDKNFGAVFIFWDRLFGTYAEEVAPPVFGLRSPLSTHNIVWARFHVLFEVAERARRARGLGSKVLALFRPPEWDPDGDHDVTSPAVPPHPMVMAARGRLRVYALCQHAILFAAVTAFVIRGEGMPPFTRLATGLWLWASMGVVGGLLDARDWAVAAELGRWAVALLVVVGMRVAG